MPQKNKKKAKKTRTKAKHGRVLKKKLHKKFKKPAKKALKKKSVKKVAKKIAKKLSKKEVALEHKAAQMILRGKERGYVTYNEILKQFPTIEDNVLFLEDLYERLSVAGVDVLESGGMLEEVPDEVVMRGSYRGEGSAHDSIQMYLREIGQYALLTAQEERDLAKRIQKGDPEAKNLLARANLRLVVSIAKNMPTAHQI